VLSFDNLSLKAGAKVLTFRDVAKFILFHAYYQTQKNGRRRAKGTRFQVPSSKFKVQGLLVRLAGRDRRSGSKVQGSKFQVQSSRLSAEPTAYHQVQGLLVRLAGRDRRSGSKVQGSRFKVQCSRFKVCSSSSQAMTDGQAAKFKGSVGREPVHIVHAGGRGGRRRCKVTKKIERDNGLINKISITIF